MRDIKFRAWDKTRKQFFTSPKWVEFQIDLSGVLTAKNFKLVGGKQELEINQYTGLKDKNGVPIYENDIVKRVVVPYDGGGDVHLGVIKWCSKNCHYYSHSIKQELSRGLGEMKGVTHEVIGNIYEHRDLLENEKWN